VEAHCRWFRITLRISALCWCTGRKTRCWSNTANIKISAFQLQTFLQHCSVVRRWCTTQPFVDLVVAYGKQSDEHVCAFHLRSLAKSWSITSAGRTHDYTHNSAKSSLRFCWLRSIFAKTQPRPRDQLSMHKKFFIQWLLSTAHRVTEIAFGITPSQLRVFHRPLMVRPQNADVN